MRSVPFCPVGLGGIAGFRQPFRSPEAAQGELFRPTVLVPWQNVRIDPNSLSFNMWKEIPVPFYMSIYFFDILNPEEILKGEKPAVQERGPYVYR